MSRQNRLVPGQSRDKEVRGRFRFPKYGAGTTGGLETSLNDFQNSDVWRAKRDKINYINVALNNEQ